MSRIPFGEGSRPLGLLGVSVLFVTALGFVSRFANAKDFSLDFAGRCERADLGYPKLGKLEFGVPAEL